MTEQHTLARWTVDECSSANAFYTIRLTDGSPNGNTASQPIATVYDLDHARLIAAAPELLAALEHISEVLANADPSSIQRLLDIARAALTKATS